MPDEARPGADLDNQGAKLSVILENAPVILYGLDADGRFTFSEGNGLAAFGVSAGQVIGDSAFALYGQTSGAWDAIQGALAGEHTTFEAHIGGAHFMSRLTPVFDAAGTVTEVVGVSLDIGDQVRAEAALSERDEQLRQSQKMEAVGQLAGGIAHDFNNLLTAIIGYSDLLLESEDRSPDSIRSDVGEIRRAAERAAGLTRQILAFSRRQPLQPQVVSINDVVSETEPLLRRTLGEDIKVNLALDPELGLVEVDPHQLVQVIMNLVLNARDAMNGRGDLGLSTANVELDEEFCWRNSDCTPGLRVMLSVSDTGLGMDTSTLSHIFEPFFTTKAPGEGTGLGLSTAYGIVRQSGGNVYVESAPGKGTTMRIYFPRVDRSAEAALPTVVPPTLATTHGSILVVEDQPSVRNLVARVLANEGYVVLAAADAAQALALLEDPGRLVDLLLTDVVLPGGMRGDALAAEAFGLRPGLPILFMSGHPRESLMQAQGVDPAVNYLAKPFTPKSLTDKVREVLELGHSANSGPPPSH